MAKKIAINLLVAFTVAAASAYGALFKVEVPTDLTKEDVLNPTADIAARLDTVLREQIAADLVAANLAAVVFTKDGELIYRAGERTETDAWSDNRLGFEPAQKNYLTN